MVLITGGTGFVGSHLIRLLLSKNYPVRAIYRSEVSKLLTAKENEIVDWVQTDLFDIDKLCEVVQGVETVFHCAATVSFDSRRRDELFKVNVEGTANLINAMLDQNCTDIIYLSSIAALGRNAKQELITEKSEWTADSKDNTQYAVSKYKAELEVRRGEAEGLNVSILYPGMIFGKGDWNKGSCAIFKRIYDGFPFYTQGITSFVDVNDVARAMVILKEQPKYGEGYILSEGNYAYKDIFTWMAKGFNKKAPSKEAKPWMSNLVWRWYELKKYFSSKEQTITRETAHSAQSQYYYGNEKFLKAFPSFEYTPIQETIANACTFYMK